MKPKVLVVDDSPTELSNIADIVAGTGCVVLRAANGKEAVELANKEQPDIIFMDIMVGQESDHGRTARSCGMK